MNTSNSPLIEKVDAAATALGDAAKRIAGEDSSVAAIREQLATSILTLVVAGEIKKGKSSFINALLEQPGIVSVDEAVATSVVAKIHFAEEVSHRVYFLPDADGGIREPLGILIEAVPEYCTEKGNPRNEKNVDFVAVGCPSPVLRLGVVLVDTPGIGGLVRSHRGVTERFIPNADAVFYVTDSQNPLDAADLEFLKLIRKRTEFIYFLQTKSDMSASIEARDEIKRGNLGTLEKEGLKAPDYFICSSRLKAQADKTANERYRLGSGFPSVLDFILNDLKARKDLIVCTPLVADMQQIANTLKGELDTRMKAYSEQSASERERIQELLRQTVEAMNRWQREDLPALQDEVASAMQQSRLAAQRALQEKLGNMGSVLDEISSAIDSCGTIEELKNQHAEFFHSAASSVSDCLLNCQEGIMRSVGSVVETACNRLDSNMPDVGGKTLAVAPFRMLTTIPAYRDNQASNFTKISNIAMRTTQWATIGALAGNLLAGPWGAVIGGAIGGWFGGTNQNSALTEQQLQQAKAQVQSEIAKCLAKYQSEAHSKIEALFLEVTDNVKKTVREAVLVHEASLKRQYQEFQERQKLSQDEFEVRRQDLLRDQAVLGSAEQRLQEVLVLMGEK